MENIKDLAAIDRPREKLILDGSAALSDAQLLAILLGSGTKEFPVLALCEQVLATVDRDLEQLSGLSMEQLCEIKGIGHAKAAVIIAAMEIGRRRLFLSHRVPKIKSDADALALVRPYFKEVDKSIIVLVLLNRQYELLAVNEMNTDQPDIGHIMELTIKAGAVGFGLASNREADQRFLSDMQAAADMLKLRFFGLLQVN